MADKNSIGSTSTSDINAESSESTLEINVKTLDSQIYRFQVDRNMPVPSLKEKVANASGVPVEQQRLIFRGKVLKDDQLLSEYHVEDGHTLHLVVRQPVQSQTPSGTNSGETNGNDARSGAPRSRMGVSHSVVLSSVNAGDQGSEGSGPNLSRIIGAVLNSIGIGNLNTTVGANNLSSDIPVASNASSQASHEVETDGTRGNNGGRSEAGNQMPAGQTFASHPYLSMRQSMRFPMTGATVVVPSPQMPIPDALHTLSEFINHMELALSATGYWPTLSLNNVGDAQRADLPSNLRGTPEALSIILRRAQQLISGHAVAAISHVAGRLEGEGGSTDPAVRNQIQTESVQVGLAVLHLGSLLLELGRTILTLRMGQSPAESLVNAGPAVYISPSGPNPIMVQPFPLQTSSLFGGSTSSQATSGTMGPVGPGDATRNVNIHIHAGSTRVVPVRNVTAAANPSRSSAAVPSRSPAETANHVLNVSHSHGRTQQNNQSHTAPPQSSPVVVSSTTLPSVGNSVPQPVSESVSIPTIAAEINAQMRNFIDSLKDENQGPSEYSTCLVSSSENSMGDNVNHQQENLAVNGAEETRGPLTDCDEQQQPECHRLRNEGEIGSWSSQEASSTSSTGIPSNSPSVGATLQCKSQDTSGCASKSGPSHDPLGADKAVPLGLGLGGLQPKRRSRQVKQQGKYVSGTSRVEPANGNQQSIATGQQVLQSLVSCGSNANPRDVNGPPEQVHPAFGQSIPMGARDSSGQLDVANMMSQVLNSPALNGLLAGVSEQAGIGSPDGLRNMLEQFTQSPSMRNTINRVVEQIDGEELSNFSGMARGQGGGIDLSRMIQQMMPIVSQAFGGAPAIPEPSYGLDSREQRYNDVSGPVEVEKPNQNSQVDLQQVTQRIERNDPPRDIFRTVAELAARLCSEGGSQDLVDELCKNEDLAIEFMEMLDRNMHQRL